MQWFGEFKYTDGNAIKNGIDRKLETKCKTLHKGFKISIPFDELGLSDNEQNILVYTPKSGLVAYNGVYADLIDYSYTVLILGNEYMPAVNVSRDRITNVPFKAAVEISLINNELNKYLKNLNISFSKPDHFYMTEKELVNNREDKWNDFINIRIPGDKTIPLRKKPKHLDHFMMFNKFSLYSNIALYLLKRNYSMTYTEHKAIKPALKEPSSKTTDTSEFPVQLFFKFDDGTKFGAIYYGYINCYNVEHWFSKWLIKNREKLQTEVNPVYKRILQIMIESTSPKMVIKDLNDILDKLKGYKNNMFDIQGIRLTQEDFIDDLSFDDVPFYVLF